MSLPSFILLLTISSASFLAFIHCYHDDDAMKKLEDKIVSLPGEPDRGGMEFDQYSGYVTVDPDAGRALFYYFVESPHSSQPLLLWLNGGPACSSLGGGAMAELGPFRVNKDGATLSYNKYAWNNVANILFLESPAGVGFSYSNKTSDYDKNGDKRTAEDSYTFLVKWLERFPEYKTRDFFITGESYAGHYIPQLAQLILKNNKISNQTFINLKGIAMGNAYIDYESEFTGFYEHLWPHALISDEIYHTIVSNCNFSSLETVSDACKDYTDQAGIARGKILLYDIYSPLCNSLFSKNYSAPTEFDPCTDDYILSYLNKPQVQKSLHALPRPWELCNHYTSSKWYDQPVTVLPVIQELMASEISVWLYSGDKDARVPITSTKHAISKLQISVKTPWYPWYFQGEVGGFVVEYENLTFATVRGAGHLVPSYQPARTLALISSFLAGQLPPPEN